jgi:glycopeptide antibiotics resistance protein
VIGYSLLLVMLLTAPLGPAHRHDGYLTEMPSDAAHVAFDALLNVAVFCPLGWGLRALVAGRWTGAAWAVLGVTVIGGLLSVGMETIQYFLPQRYSAATDVLFNTVGTAIGALAAHRRETHDRQDSTAGHQPPLRTAEKRT